MKKFLNEFKDFAVKGNLVELAVAFVLAAAFGVVVKSLVDDVIMQIVAAIFGQPDFASLTIDVGDAVVRYGAFLNAVIVFILVALAVFVFIVKPYNAIKARQEQGAEDAPAPAEDIVLLREIRDALKR